MFQFDLVERCKANDRKAQLKLYKQYCDGMFCVAMRFLKNPDDAEDVLQESFIKAFQKIHQFRGEVTFGAWLKRIVVNHALDFIKSKKEHHVELQEHTLHIVEDDDWTVADTVSVAEVRSAMQKLPEKYRFVVQLYLVEGYDHGEIAQILELTETTCRTRLLRGKTQLKELINNKHYGTGS
ncbi:MAG TPA: RNA polymerase sigma factor [Eudoraea sp.]|nr:RNA polymerase sigma factor [Eudoraea sp.]